MITSPKTRLLIVRQLRPAFQWESEEVLHALEECQATRDIVGASALFSRLNEEHKCFFGVDFRNRNAASQVPADTLQEAIVANCSSAALVYDFIRMQVDHTDALA